MERKSRITSRRGVKQYFYFSQSKLGARRGNYGILAGDWPPCEFGEGVKGLGAFMLDVG